MKVPDYARGFMAVFCSLFLNYGCMSASVSRDQMTNSSNCRSRYGYKYYYDHGTDHCEQCREICQNARIMGTVEQCEAECKPYLTAMKCAEKKNQYYDEMLDMCSPCSSLCDNHQATGNTRVCREHCSDYLKKLTPKQVPSRHRQNYLKALDGSEAEETSQNSDLALHPGWIASLAVGGVALVCLVVVVIVLLRTCQQQQYGLAPQGEKADETVVRRPPVPETSQGSEDAVHFAIDGTSGQLPPTVGFSDLPTTAERV